MNRGYCRVSTQEQGKEGISLQMQERTIKNYLHHQPVRIYRDVGTGRNCKRTQLQQLLKDLVEGDKVLVFRLDRISWSVCDLSNLVREFEVKRVDFVSCQKYFDITT